MSSAHESEHLEHRVNALERALTQMEELETVRHLRERYCLYVDGKRWTELRALLTPDYQHFSTNDVGAEPALVADSAEAFVQRLVGLTEGATTVHFCGMPTITLDEPDAAQGRWAMTDVVSHPSNERMRFSGRGHYDDVYKKGADGVWRIAVTRLTRQRLDRLPVPESSAAASSSERAPS